MLASLIDLDFLTVPVFLRQDGFWLDSLLNHQGDSVIYVGLREGV